MPEERYGILLYWWRTFPTTKSFMTKREFAKAGSRTISLDLAKVGVALLKV
jgi:hypothetical protein